MKRLLACFSAYMDFIKHMSPKDNTSEKAPVVVVCDVLNWKKENGITLVSLKREDESLWFCHESGSSPLKTQRWNTFPYLESNSYRSRNIYGVILSAALPQWWENISEINGMLTESFHGSTRLLWFIPSDKPLVPIHAKRAKYLFWLEQRERNVS